MFWIFMAAIIMGIVLFKMGVLSILTIVLLLCIKALLTIVVLTTGVTLWKQYKNRKQKQLPGGTYESDR